MRGVFSEYAGTMTMVSRIYIDATAAHVMRLESELKYPHETGGILLGTIEGDTAAIGHASGPGPKAQHTRYRFVRDGAYAQHVLESILASSGGTQDYLGEWHSHPSRSPVSHRDRSSMRWISRNKSYDCKYPLMVIMMRVHEGGWQLRAYQWQEGSLARISVEVREDMRRYLEDFRRLHS